MLGGMEEKTILLAEYGSRAYGTNTVDSDTDMVRVVLEPARFVTGLDEFKAISEHTAENGARSTAVDTDTSVYGLQKFADLAVTGNPTILGVLYVDTYEEISPYGEWLVASRDFCLSKAAGRRFLGYMTSQRAALTGMRNKRTNRPELVHTHGFDTKFAYHMIRLGLLGREYMIEGTLQLPMKQDLVDICMDIRAGKWTKEETLDFSYSLEEDLENIIAASDLPDKGNRAGMSELLHEIYMEEWNTNGA